MLIRKSMVEAYVLCPMMAKLKFVDGKDANSNNVFAQMGKRFHDWVSWFYSVVSIYDDQNWESVIPSVFGSEERRWAMNFIKWERRRLSFLRKQGRESEWYPIGREIQLTSNKLSLWGTIDLALWYDRSNMQVLLVEFKTTGDMDVRSLRRQLSLYALLYETADQPMVGHVTHIGCYNPRLDQWWMEELKERSVLSVLKWIEKIEQSMKTNVWNYTKNLYTCMFCDVSEFCERWSDEWLAEDEGGSAKEEILEE